MADPYGIKCPDCGHSWGCHIWHIDSPQHDYRPGDSCPCWTEVMVPGVGRVPCGCTTRYVPLSERR